MLFLIFLVKKPSILITFEKAIFGYEQQYFLRPTHRFSKKPID